MILCHITPTIMDGIVVRWNPENDDNAEISASRNGIMVHAWPIIATAEYRGEFEKTLRFANAMHRVLADADARGPFSRITCDEVRAWLVERSVHVVDRRFGETLAEAVKREEANRG